MITILGTKSIVEIQNPETGQNMSDVPPSLGGHTTKLAIRLPTPTTLEQVHLRMTFPYDLWESVTQSHYPPTIHTPCNDFDVAQVILHAIFHKVLANISQSGLWSHNTNPFARNRSMEGLPNPKPPSKQGEPRLRLTNKYWTVILWIAGVGWLFKFPFEPWFPNAALVEDTTTIQQSQKHTCPFKKNNMSTIIASRHLPQSEDVSFIPCLMED